MWPVGPSRDQKRLLQAGREHAFRNHANDVLVAEPGERAADGLKLEAEKIGDIAALRF
jgi:hypothetical protein